ncbi:MAG TPA: iron ABC transporter permease [Treponemataceae bacterium]|nr:iron ABC transporter permease [Treponemataceae bacterium]
MIDTRRHRLDAIKTFHIVLHSIALGVLALVLLSFIVPSIFALLPVFMPSFAQSISDNSVMTFESFLKIARALRFTLTQALLSALIAVFLGVPAAFLVSKRNFPFRRFLLALSGVPLCVPPMIIALAFVLFYGRQGWLNTILMRVFSLKEPPVTFLYSMAGVVIAHGFYNFPVVLRTVSRVWERLPESEEEAAYLLGARPFRLFRTVTLPHLLSSIFSSSILVFLYCFFSFIIVMLFGGIGGTTLEVELYRAARSSFNFRFAGFIALVETVCASGVLVLYVYVQRFFSSGSSGINPVRKRKNFSKWREILLSVIFLSSIGFFFVGPLMSVIVRSFQIQQRGSYAGTLEWSLTVWKNIFSRPSLYSAVISTVIVSSITALTATLAALAFALSQNRKSSFVSLIPFAPLAVSSVMLGFGWTLFIPQGSVFVLVCAESAIAWPFAWTQIKAALDRIPLGVNEASLLLSRNGMDSNIRVRIPLVLPGILSGAALVFAISAGDATLPLVLSLGKFENLPLMLYRLVGSYRFSEACACAVILALLSGFVFFLQDIK